MDSGGGARPMPKKTTTQDVMAQKDISEEALDDLRQLNTQGRREVVRGLLGGSFSSSGGGSSLLEGETGADAASNSREEEQQRGALGRAASRRPVVVVVGVSEQRLEPLRAKAAAIGMTLNESLTAATTHVAIDIPGCPQPPARTPVYLEALLRGLAVVKVGWLWDNIQQHEDEQQQPAAAAAAAAVDTALPSISDFYNDAARAAWEGRETGRTPLLAGYDVVLGAGVEEAGVGPPDFPKDVLVRMIGLAGGRVVGGGGGGEPGGTPLDGGVGGAALPIFPEGPRGQLLVVQATSGGDAGAPFHLEELGADWAAASSAISVMRISVDGLLDAFEAHQLPGKGSEMESKW